MSQWGNLRQDDEQLLHKILDELKKFRRMIASWLKTPFKFQTVNGQQTYTPTEIGGNLTGRELYLVIDGQSIVSLDAPDVQITSSGGLQFNYSISSARTVIVLYV